MNEQNHIQYSTIQNYPYAELFKEVKYSGKTLNSAERKHFITVIDEYIDSFSEGLLIVKKNLDDNRITHDEFHEAYNILVSVLHFVFITMTDSMVIAKYFVLADKDYDRRFMRGKMKVIINEGFKKLYGFDEKTHEKSEWHKLFHILKYFPEDIQHQYRHLSSLLDEHSKFSSWWRDERNKETHLDAEKLYESRCEDIVESKVMMDSLKLFDTLFAVECFLSNMLACFRNSLVDMYLRGELKEELFK